MGYTPKEIFEVGNAKARAAYAKKGRRSVALFARVPRSNFAAEHGFQCMDVYYQIFPGS